MSIRPGPPEHVFVRGTMVSTDSGRPSKLPVAALQVLGLPGKTGTMVVDNITLHVTYDANPPDIVYIYASDPEHVPTSMCICS